MFKKNIALSENNRHSSAFLTQNHGAIESFFMHSSSLSNNGIPVLNQLTSIFCVLCMKFDMMFFLE